MYNAQAQEMSIEEFYAGAYEISYDRAIFSKTNFLSN